MTKRYMLAAATLVAALAAVGACVPLPAAPAAKPTSAASASTVGATAFPERPTVAPSLGEVRIRPADGAAMVYVPNGEFEMGSDAAALDRARRLCIEYSTDAATARASCSRRAFADEQPAHRVTIDGFWIDKTETTNGRYGQCVAARACTPPAETGSYTRELYYGDPMYGDFPVIWVTWEQASIYCAWVGARLPTEAEWEYAARGPQGSTYPWGDAFDGTLLNYCDARCPTGPKDSQVDDGYADTAPVGSFVGGASWCGALDLAGNVREWVSDWYGDYPTEPQANPQGPPSGESRIPRGGSWLDLPDDIRSANRGANAPDYTRHKVGFRCAM